MTTKTKLVGVVVLALTCGLVGSAVAHWCSNIFVTRARIIVKPEKDTIFLSSTPTPLRVYLQNNFPYKIRAYMRATSGSTIYPATPSSGYRDVYPGQNVSYLFNVTGSGSTAVSTLNLQMKFRTMSSTNPNDWTWRSQSDGQLYQTPSQSNLISDTADSQSGSLSAAMLAERYPSATLSTASPWFGHTGMQQLIKWFGYRFCWNSSGGYRCTSQDCPSPCAEGAGWTSIDQFAQLCMRAGAEVGARKATLGSNLTAARNAAVNALAGTGSPNHKCLAAVVGGYLYQGVTATTFITALQSSGNSVPTICQNAGLRAQGQGSSSSCTSGQHYERAACAAAEGLRNNNGPVTSVLLPNAGDGTTGVAGYDGLYYSYMLYIVQAYRKDTLGTVPFYPDAGVSGCTTAADCNDSNVCTTDSCVSNACQHAPISGCCTSASQCNDSNACTTDTCVSNACQHATISNCCTSSTQCNDSNVCTTDSCVSNACQHAPISNCCTSASQCNDNNVCTTDACASNVCQNSAISGCCTSNTQCNDSNVCTTDTCVSNACQHSTITGCCTSSTQCSDGNSCTTDACVSNACQFTPIANCCTNDGQCNDSNVCTTDTCNTATGTCSNVQQTGCCAFDTDCADSNPCTTDTCVSNACQHTAVSACCTTAAQCDDGDICTADTCVSNSCQHSPICGADLGPREGGPADLGPRETSPDRGPADQGPADQGPTGDQDPGHDSTPQKQGMVLDGGCGCAVGTTPHKGPALALLVLLLLLVWRRKRY